MTKEKTFQVRWRKFTRRIKDLIRLRELLLARVISFVMRSVWFRVDRREEERYITDKQGAFRTASWTTLDDTRLGYLMR